SSRRQHTRFSRDWSSDVCSSDLFSMLADKDINSVVKLLKEHIRLWKIAPLAVPRAAEVTALTEALSGEAVEQFNKVQFAFKSALDRKSVVEGYILGLARERPREL